MKSKIFIEQLKSNHPEVVWSAVSALIELRDPMSVPYLLELLKHESGDVKNLAARVLDEIKPHPIW